MELPPDPLQLALRIVETAREPFLVLDEILRVRFANRSFYARFEVDPTETVGRPLRDLGNGQWNIPALGKLLEQVVGADSRPFNDYLVEQDFENIGGRSMLLNARKLAAGGNGTSDSLILLAIEDITDRQRGEARLSRQALEATLLHKATALAAETSSFEDALEACVEIVCELTGWPVGHVCLPDADDPDSLVTTNIWHLRDRGDLRKDRAFAALREATERVKFGRGEGLPGQIRESGEPAWVVNLQESGPHARTDLARRAGVKGAFGFPIKIRGETVAVLEFFSERPMGPDRSLLAMVRSLGEQVGRVIERTRAETALRQSERELTELFEQAAVGLLFLSPDAIVQRANDAFLETLGYQQHEFVGRPVREFLLEKASAEAIEECSRSGCSLAGHETRFRAKDGSTRHLLLDANARTSDGKIVYLRCFARDVTDLKRDESERARLAAIVQSSDDAIVGLSADGLITSWNRGAERLYGYVAPDVIGGSISVVVPPEREEEMTRLLETVKRGERVEQFETVRIHRDGRRIHVSMTASPILAGGTPTESRAESRERREESRESREKDAGPAPLSRLSALDSRLAASPAAVVGVAVIERDVSERRRVAAEIRRAVREAERANRAKGEFLANVSHELRTPMNAIIGMTELALDEQIPELVRDYLDTAKDNAEVLLRLLNDILDFSRIEAGRFELDEAKFDLRQTLEETVKALAVRAHEKGLEIALEMPPAVPDRLFGDPVRLRQVLSNLISNAVKFTETGEIVVQVEPHALRERDAELHFTVRDTGIGISPADQERIFAPFAQVDATSTRHHGGAGLGLAICRELVAMMDGRLWVESRLGAGTTFHFLATFRLQPEAGTPPTPVRELKGLPVLVVDDNATNRRILEDTLKSWHMRPVTARTAEEAFDELRKAADSDAAFPLVIVDGLMPGTDGFTLVERIKTDAHLSGATVLMLSNADRRLFRERCETLDIAAYLEKPVTQSELLDTIVTALHGPPLERDAAETAGGIGGTERTLSILLVEDTPANRKVVTAVLDKRGHKVTIAADGREAVDLFKRRRDFDVVLMDVQMPNMDGLQATGIIRTIEHGRGGRVPVVAMTAHAMRGDRERCLAAGMDAYLSKPIDVRRMIRLIERVARRRRTDAAASRSGFTRSAAGTTSSRPDGRKATQVRALTQSNGTDGKSESYAAGPTPGFTRWAAKGGDMSAESSQRPVFDKPSAIERLGGDEQLFRELAVYFLEDSEELLQRIETAAAEGDWPAVRIEAHSLKGLAANFSARPATDAARDLEQAAADGPSQRAETLIPYVRTETERLRNALASSANEHST